jgi:O-antigen/teichoic acid export membrane protein
MSRTGRAAKGFVTSIFQFIAQIVVQALLAPIVLKMAGRETLGAYAAVMQALSFISLTDFIGSWTLERFLGQANGLDDGGARFRLILTTTRTVFIFCNLVYAFCVVIFSLFTQRLFHLSPPVAHQAQHALWVIAAWAIIRTPLAAYLNASIALQDLAVINMIGTGLAVGRAIASLAFVLLGGGLFGLMLAGTFVEGCGYFLYRVRFKKMNPHLMPGWGIPDKVLLKELLSFGAHAFLLNLGNGLIFNSGNTMAGFTKGAAVGSSFYTTQLPTTTAYNVTMRLSDSATPAVNELWGRREVEKLRQALTRVTRLLLALTLPLATGVALFNRDLVITWVGSQQYAGSLLTASLAAFCVIVSLQRTVIVYAFTFGWMHLLTTSTLIVGIANFALAFLLVKHVGLGGITLALVIVILPQTILLWHRVGHFMELSVFKLLGGCFLRGSIPLTSATICSMLVHRVIVIRPRHIFGLVVEMLTFLVVYASLAYPLVLFDHDRKEIKRYLRNFANRGKNMQQRMLRVFGTASN